MENDVGDENADVEGERKQQEEREEEASDRGEDLRRSENVR